MRRLLAPAARRPLPEPQGARPRRARVEGGAELPPVAPRAGRRESPLERAGARRPDRLRRYRAEPPDRLLRRDRRGDAGGAEERPRVVRGAVVPRHAHPVLQVPQPPRREVHPGRLLPLRGVLLRGHARPAEAGEGAEPPRGHDARRAGAAQADGRPREAAPVDRDLPDGEERGRPEETPEADRGQAQGDGRLPQARRRDPPLAGEGVPAAYRRGARTPAARPFDRPDPAGGGPSQGAGRLDDLAGERILLGRDGEPALEALL